jgi:hypothetical protein
LGIASLASICLPVNCQDVDFKKLQTLPALVKAAKIKEIPERSDFETVEKYVQKILASGKEVNLVVDLPLKKPYSSYDQTGFWYDPAKEAFILREYVLHPSVDGPSKSKKLVGGNTYGAVASYTSATSIYYSVDPIFWIKGSERGVPEAFRISPEMVAASGLAQVVKGHDKSMVLEMSIPTSPDEAARKTKSFAVVYVGKVFGIHNRYNTFPASVDDRFEHRQIWSELLMDARDMKVFIVDKSTKTVLAKVNFATIPSGSSELVIP